MIGYFVEFQDEFLSYINSRTESLNPTIPSQQSSSKVLFFGFFLLQQKFNVALRWNFFCCSKKIVNSYKLQQLILIYFISISEYQEKNIASVSGVRFLGTVRNKI